MSSNIQERPKQLDDWLDKVDAQLLGGYDIGVIHRVEKYLINSRICFVELRDAHGRTAWEIYTPNGQNSVEATLTDAASRLGIK